MAKKRAVKIAFLVLFIILFILSVAAYLAIYGISTFAGIPSINAKILSKDISINLLQIKQSFPKVQMYSWVALAAEFLMVIFISFSLRSKPEEQQTVDAAQLKQDITEKHSRANTDLDSLYEALKKEKRIKLSSIMKVFNISEELATEWCKILETGNLATLNYPRMGDAEIVINSSDNQNGKKE